ncbi:hypothetical protein ACW9IO_23880 [Pseudomonas azotoformans]
MEIKNNPTGRLFDILTAVKRRNDTIQTRAVWSDAFGCEPNDTAALLNCIADLIRLVAEAKDATMRLIKGDQAIYLAPFPTIEAMLSRLNLDNQWQGSKVHLNEKTMMGLQFGDHALAFHYGERQFDDELISGFIRQLDELLKQCLDSDLSENLKKLFHRNLEALRHALIVFKISGASGLEDEIDRVTGSIIRNTGEIKSSTSESSNKDFTNKVFELITKLNESIQIVQNTVALSGPATTALAMLLHKF